MYKKFDSKVDFPDHGILYCFRDRSQFERCVQKKCSLIAKDNAYEATDLTSAVYLVSSFAVELWRLEKRLNSIKDTNQVNSGIDLDPVFDQIQRIKDIFDKEGIEIKDPLNENYNDGMSVKVLHFEEDKNLAPGVKRIIETVRPAVVFKDQVISHGEVIVAKAQDNNRKE